MTTVLVCDDEEFRASQWVEAIEPVVSPATTVTPLAGEAFAGGMAVLDKRRRIARDEDMPGLVGKCVFDDADVLVIDYDLIGFQPESSLTGEIVAYLARTYSSCGYIVVLNQFGDRYFDLALRGNRSSFADLNLGGSFVGSPGLWNAASSEKFRPWSWPLLTAAAERHRRRSEALVGSLDVPILEYLGIGPDLMADMGRAKLEAVLGDDGASFTFAAFAVESGRGLKAKDRPASLASVAAIAAARVSAWLEQIVLPSQDFLVDAPHLVSRFPSLLKGDPSEVGTWNAAADLSGQAGSIDVERLGSARFVSEDWLSRSTWYWPVVASDAGLAEASDPWSGGHTDFVFCEDLSRYLPRNQAREFVADLHSPFVRRFVADPQALTDQELKTELESIDYRPAVRLAM